MKSASSHVEVVNALDLLENVPMGDEARRLVEEGGREVDVGRPEKVVDELRRGRGVRDIMSGMSGEPERPVGFGIEEVD